MKNKVLIADDMEINREILAEILKEEYQIIEADSGITALEMIEKHRNDLVVILLDLVMPEMDGLAVLEELKKQSLMEMIPVLVISGENSMRIVKECYEYGISDFIHKPFDSYLVRKRVQNVVDLFLYKNRLEEKVEKQTEMLREQADRLKKSNDNIIDILGTVVESRNLESGEHVKRVKNYTRILARQIMEQYPEYHLTPERIEVIVSASALHDIGKIAIPDSILLKPARLTDEEFEYMKQHTTKGCCILNEIKGVWNEEYGKVSYEICRSHHERYDGRGYPDGLVGDEIPISAQIVSIADVYDALVNERVYKKAFPLDKAYDMIVNGECGTFSPKLMTCFAKSRKEFEQLTSE